MLRTTTLAFTVAGLVAIAGAAPAMAQDDLLRGPKASHAGPADAPEGGALRQYLRDPTPAGRHRLLMAAIGTLERDEALALSGDQREAIEAQDRIYRAALEAHREANGEAYKALRPERPDRPERPERAERAERDARRVPREGAEARADAPQRERAHRRAPADPAQREQMRDEMRQRGEALRALEMNAPSSAEIDANIRGLLRADQQQAVERRMERLRNAAADRRRDRHDGGAEGDRPRRAEGRLELTEQQIERIRNATKDMTPEERREFMRRLRERLGEGAPRAERPEAPSEEVEAPARRR